MDTFLLFLCVCLRACVHVCVRACVRVCVFSVNETKPLHFTVLFAVKLL